MITSNDKPFVSVIIPVRNEGPRLQAAVSSIADGRSANLAIQIVVVDDESSDGCCDGLGASYSWSRDRIQIQTLRLPRWSGIPCARNAGAAAARADVIFMTDANVLFPRHWDVHLHGRLHPRRVLCATIADAASPFRGYGCTLHLPSMGANWLPHPGIYGGHVPVCPSAGTIIPTELFRRAGGYDTAMPIYGAAEPEFSVRLWLSGAEIVALPDLVLHHHFRPASERRGFLEAIRLVQMHNYLRFGLLYLDPPRVIQMLRHYAAESAPLFQRALRRVWSGDVWSRREVLGRLLPDTFASFVRRFGLRDALGRVPV